jgi:hypothetical protein
VAALPATYGRDECTRDRRADDAADGHRHAPQRIGLLQALVRDELRKDAGGRGSEERRGASVHGLEHDQVPEVCVPRQEQCGQRPVRRQAHGVGADHQAAARKPVGDDATGQEERNERRGSGSQHVADVGRRPCEIEDGERDRDRHHLVADLRHRRREEHKTEVALREHAKTAGRHSHAGA